ncbi:MAG: VacJ family lipoprotein [Gammaproteobacteria bacterium]|nr:VacJ family lipoprotein [Gammaproteobacteria bacterium]
MSKVSKIIILLASTVFIITGCATKKPANPADPYEAYNRAMFSFNSTVDKYAVIPVAKTYDFILPGPAKTGVSNFFGNLDELPNITNDLLQAKPGWAIADLWRLFFNSTLGIGGLFDVATPFGLKKRTQDLGLTFAKWGAKDSPFIVLPLLGPSTIRDSVGLLTQYKLLTVYPYLHNWQVSWSLISLEYIDTRADLLPADKLIQQSFDPYVFVRSAYLQHRTHQIDTNEALKGQRIGFGQHHAKSTQPVATSKSTTTDASDPYVE